MTERFRDIDGAFVGYRYHDPNFEAAERRRWAKERGAPYWTLPAWRMMELVMPTGTVITNQGVGPSLGDLVRAGYFRPGELEQ